MAGSWRTRGSWELWQWSCRKDARRFRSALRNPAAAQLAHLRSILSFAEGSLWARRWGVHASLTLDEFRERVPVQKPEDLAIWTDRILRGEQHVLTTARLERLVPTSGTTGKPKLIPLTPQSRDEFSTGVNLWLSDAIRHSPEIKLGRCYIATSPAIDIDTERAHSVPVGFAGDAAYLGRIERSVLERLVAVPGSVARLRGTAWRTATREYLVRATDLRFLSLWHPGYLNALFDEEELIALVAKWPNVALVSTWADGACVGPARELMTHFPQAKQIPKGLWLTEGVVSVPWRSAHPIALPCGFFEFEGEDGTLLLAHELEIDSVYRPVITNHAGLYRYRLGDLVKVTEYLDETPSIRWVGRADRVSDLCGEKLSEAEVAQAFDAIGWDDIGTVMPVSKGTSSHYVCLVAEGEVGRFPARRFEEELRKNPHYDWARKIDQLGPLEVLGDDGQTFLALESEFSQRSTFHRKGARLCI